MCLILMRARLYQAGGNEEPTGMCRPASLQVKSKFSCAEMIWLSEINAAVVSILLRTRGVTKSTRPSGNRVLIFSRDSKHVPGT